ncbi:MAG: hypothetical protein HeimC3_16340 [Candidatus Heimdallarchaeota archaeon LC_3]|nr:MAG: hypothetical protein HeimC3_16340 [Candidatus Heimdallarchaeota archaeon LC_3]
MSVNDKQNLIITNGGKGKNKKIILNYSKFFSQG